MCLLAPCTCVGFTSCPRCMPTLGALPHPETAKNLFSLGWLFAVVWPFLSLLQASLFNAASFFLLFSSHSNFVFPAFRRQRLHTLISNRRHQDWKALKRTGLSLPIHLVLWQLFLVGFPLVRQCCGRAGRFPASAVGCLLLMAALVKR